MAEKEREREGKEWVFVSKNTHIMRTAQLRLTHTKLYNIHGEEADSPHTINSFYLPFLIRIANFILSAMV